MGFFTIAVITSLLTYMSEGDFSFFDNILNTTDLIVVISISLFTLLYGDKSTKFSPFDTGCLIAVTGITLFWIFSQIHFISHISIQIITAIAYFPVIRRLWKSGRNTESFSPWIGMLTASVLSLFSNAGVLAAVYSWRAIVSILLLLLLMIRVEVKSRGRAVS